MKTLSKKERVRTQAEAAEALQQSLWRIRLRLWKKTFLKNWRIFKESRIGVIGLVIIVFFGLFGTAYPLLMGTVWDPLIYDPVTGYSFGEVLQPAPPSTRHLLGTDPLGRDVFSQVMYSTGREFLLGILAAVITVSIGTIIGSVAAYYGGFVDTFFMRLADVVILFPFIAFLIILSALMDLTLVKFALVLGLISGFGGITIILKSQALSIKVKPYIEAARVAGGSPFHIIFTHIIPNILPLSFLYMMFTVTGAIFSEAILSFFGLLNIRMSWGIIIHTTEATGYLVNLGSFWWLWLPPGLAITMLCAAFYLVGRGLDEVVNPRLRKR
ncbi:MAG: ABC transporter permease [Candidatus Bipolaricaulia bacterium]